MHKNSTTRQRRPFKVNPKAVIHWTLDVPEDSLELGVVAWGANQRGDAVALHIVDTGNQLPDVFLVGLVGPDSPHNPGRVVDSRHRHEQYVLRNILPIPEWPSAVEVTCQRTLSATPDAKPHSRVDADIEQLVRTRLALSAK